MDTPFFWLVRQTNFSIATTMPVSNVSTVRINARFMPKTYFSLVHLKNRKESLLRNFDRSYLFHPALAGLLLLQ